MSRQIQLPTKAAEPSTDVNIFKKGWVPLWARMQTFRDTWRNRDRVFRWYGACVVCGRNCFAFDDGENDPRGALGDNTLWTTTAPDNEEFEIRTCAMCANDQESYCQARQMYTDALRNGGSLDALRPIRWPGR